MGLESTTNIAGLDQTWPTSNDFKIQGDDHIRIIKNVLKTTFPGSGGNGFSIPIFATENEINYLSGVTGALQTQIDAKAPLISPFFGGTPRTNTPPVETATEQLINGAWFFNQSSTTNPLPNALTASPGSGKYWSRHDHVHPTQYPIATKAQCEAYNGSTVLTPANLFYSFLAPKALAYATSAGTLLYSVRVSAVTPFATGKVSVAFTGFTMLTENYFVLATAYDQSSGVCRNITITSTSTVGFSAQCVNDAGTLVNPDRWGFVVYGQES